MNTSSSTPANPDQSQMPGEVERDNDALRGNDSDVRDGQKKTESTAQSTAQGKHKTPKKD